MLPTRLFRNLLFEKDWWPQSWPTTKSAQNMVPCAIQYSGHVNLHAHSVHQGPCGR